jgi:hypothetical protein
MLQKPEDGHIEPGVTSSDMVSIQCKEICVNRMYLSLSTTGLVIDNTRGYPTLKLKYTSFAHPAY